MICTKGEDKGTIESRKRGWVWSVCKKERVKSDISTENTTVFSIVFFFLGWGTLFRPNFFDHCSEDFINHFASFGRTFDMRTIVIFRLQNIHTLFRQHDFSKDGIHHINTNDNISFFSFSNVPLPSLPQSQLFDFFPSLFYCRPELMVSKEIKFPLSVLLLLKVNVCRVFSI